MPIKSIAVPMKNVRSAAVANDPPLRRTGGGSMHRYHVGQRLALRQGTVFAVGAGSECTVMALLPSESIVLRYRVQTDSERHERVVSESDLSPVAE
jgi:hypothetical protein